MMSADDAGAASIPRTATARRLMMDFFARVELISQPVPPRGFVPREQVNPAR
jgi:hypothetical protein